MSYDIYLNDPVTGEPLEFADTMDLRGGTFALGGTTEAWLNITYNYSSHFRRVFGDENISLNDWEKLFGSDTGIRRLYGMSAKESIPILEKAIDMLSTDEDSDYWKPTEGNARKALSNLLIMAKALPHGVWSGD